MGQALAITRMDHTAWELRAIAGKSSDGPQIRRLLAIALVLDGDPRTQAAEQTGMDRQTLRDWVLRFSQAGDDANCPPHGAMVEGVAGLHCTAGERGQNGTQATSDGR